VSARAVVHPSVDPMARTNSSTLTFAQLPESAKVALGAARPALVAWDTTTIADSVRARVHASANEGWVVLRGNFFGATTEDYVVSGYDGASLAIMALSAQRDGSYRVVGISDGAPKGDGVEAPVVLSLTRDESPSAQAPPDIQVKFIYEPAHVEIYRWFPEDKRFLLVNERN
jgi:hypothetical protein